MKSISERINDIKDYFLFLNIVAESGASYIATNFKEENLSQSLINSIKEKYDVTITSNNGLIYFFTKIEIDPDILFDAIEYVISYNKIKMEKAALFQEKMAEMRDLFKNENIENLKSLELVLGRGKTTKKNNKKKNAPENEEKPEVVEPTEEVNETKSEEYVENAEEDSILTMAENMINNG